jgi:phosphate transport system protein
MCISKIGHHILRQFNEELEEIRNKVLAMGGLVEQQFEFAMHCGLSAPSNASATTR